MSTPRTIAVAALAASALLVPALAPAQAHPRTSQDTPHGRHFSAGAPGVGDPYFPLAGNGGYDVRHYDLDIDYTPPGPEPAPLKGSMDAVATIDLVATKNLDRFNLDLRGLTATSVKVDGHRARFVQERGNELVITPRPRLRAGHRARVVVEYGGTTTRPVDIEDALYGWVTTRDGAMVVSEPDGSATWFPVNDHPSDKASYRFEITVPQGLTVAANGLLVGSRTRHGRTTWTWNAPDPMAAYLATATIGNFDVHRYVAPSGVPVLDFLDRDLTAKDRATSRKSLALTGQMLTFFSDAFGPYPFRSYGAIVDDDSVDYALETQTRSFFSEVASEGTVAHELAHQWMGDHVSPERWADIWLNEGWASYAAWMWDEAQGRATVQESYENILATPADDDFWASQVSDPGALGLFGDAIYDRGAATLQALRLEIGDAAFFTLARTWVARYGGRSASTDDFRALAEEVSRQDLESLFDAWLDSPAKPTTW
jgi:aminopeptidase N